MNDMYEQRLFLSNEARQIANRIGVFYPIGVRYENLPSKLGEIRKEAEKLVARAEVLEREYATVSRIISAIESRAKEEEVQVLQGAIQPDPTNAGSVQPSVCDPVSQG